MIGRRKESVVLAAVALAMIAVFASCGLNQAVIEFAITDAPIDSTTVKAVNVVISSVSVNEYGVAEPSESSWISTAIEPPFEANLLDLQNGLSVPLADLVLRGGVQINQIRLGVDSVTVVETDDSVHEAVLPSDTGFKIVNAFRVPLSGEIAVSIDFDVRKAICATATGYLVKPAVRAVVDGEAGRISGSIGATDAVAVYAYAEGTFTTDETVPGIDGETFQNAYSATLVKDDGTYVLAFMDAGEYDLYAVDATGTVVATIDGVEVVPGITTDNQDF